MDVDDRIITAANIAGRMLSEIPDETIKPPFLLLDSDHGENGHSDDNIANNRLLLKHFGPGTYRYEMSRANQFSFADAPLLLAPPGGFALSLLICGGRGPAEAHQTTMTTLDTYLSGPLKSSTADIAAAAANNKETSGGHATR
jgi:hypothetical protein